MRFLVLLLFRVPDIFQAVSPPIIVARDTTYITAPLRRDGLPDYEKYWLETVRKGVTPENNACVLLWQAAWPEKFDARDNEMMRAELGLKQLPSTKDALQNVYGEANEHRIRDWLKAKGLSHDDASVEKIFDLADGHPWTAQQLPPLADWVRENEGPLNLVVQASHRPRYYAPSPSLLDKYHDPLIVMLLPGGLGARHAANSLRTRATLRVGENRLDDAWSDLFAIHRLARLQKQGRTLVDQFEAASTSDIACYGTLVLLSSDHITPELARQINHDLAGLGKAADFVDMFDHYERLETLDSIIDITRHGPIAVLTSNNPLKRFFFWITPIDRNVILRHVNQWYDRMVAVLKLRDRSEQKREYAKLTADMAADAQTTKTQAYIDAAILSRTHKSEYVASFAWNLLKPDLDDAITMDLRTRTTFQMTRLAAALAAFRTEHRAYPAKLDELVPGVVEKLPVDLYSSKPFAYKRTDDGYLLYSLGDNGKDDGGDNKKMELVAGRPLEDLKNSDKRQSKIATNADDLAIRLPRAPFQLSKAAAPAK